VFGKEWLSTEEIKKIAAKAAHQARCYAYEGGKQRICTQELSYDYIDVSPVITYISADTFYNDFQIIRYVRKMPAEDFIAGRIKLDVYGRDKKIPGVKGAILTEKPYQFSDPFDEEETKSIFKEKKGVDVCIIYSVHQPEKCQSGIHSPLGLIWE
jgi:3'-phosphoadenosine 5'-phosphosulfate sulfotransferase (PAPS reductase)/FAD synthetase